MWGMKPKIWHPAAMAEVWTIWSFSVYLAYPLKGYRKSAYYYDAVSYLYVGFPFIFYFSAYSL